MRFLNRCLKPVVIFPLVCVWLLLGGCVRPESDEVRLQFSFWGSVEQQKVEEAIIEGFEADHPNIRIETLPIGQRYTDKIQAMMVGNVAPDIIMVEMQLMHEWASRGALLDLTEDMALLSEGREIMPLPLKAADHEGKIFAAPVNVTGVAVFVNKTALKQAGIEIPEGGLTWEFIEEVAPRLSRRSATGSPDSPTDYAIMLPDPTLQIWANGGEIFDDPHNPTKAVVNTPAAVEALERHRRLLLNRYAVPPDVSADQGTFQLFRDGKVAFFFDGRWRTPDFRGIEDFEWDVVAVPAGSQGRVSRHGGTFIGISSKTKYPEEAREFLRYYVGGEGALLAMRGGRYIPIFRDLAFGEEFLNSRPPESIQVFSETMEEGAAKIPLYAVGTLEANGIISRRMQQVASYPNLAIEEILKGLETDLNRWLARRKNK